MKHLFIINPIAGGKRSDADAVSEKITGVMRGLGADFELYRTTAPMDACRKAREAAESGDEIRIYACGGDGTLNECVNGAAGFPNAAVTHYPCGTGNDFIKTFGDEKDGFFDLPRLVNGDVRPIDVIDVNGRASVSICSVGVDARIGSDVHKYSMLPVVGGAAGYVVSLVVNLFKGINMTMTVKADGETYSGRFALMCACNGRYYGGGFNPIPEAMPDDGFMDVLLVKEVSFFRFLALVGKYAAGRYRELGDIIIRLRTKRLELESPESFIINVDGETIRGRTADFRTIPGGVNMIFPSGMRFFDSRPQKTAVI